MSEPQIKTPSEQFGTCAVMIPPPPAGSWPRVELTRPSPKPQRLRLSPGQTIPGTSWRITRWLGEGNMGVVYEARHVEIDRRAAIKVVVASLADDPAAVERFRAEARAAATVGSPNIVDVFDFAVLDDGRLMMAMEFVPGRSLQGIFLAEGRIAPGRLIGLFRQVCKGLQAAHEAGLVHRDIKPENIMVGEIAGRRDTVKLVDFGIATMLGERTSTHAGTPYYMPPEGLLGGAIDGRYDVYSVGCVLYEMLAGKPPFVDESVDRVLEMHQYAPVPELVTDDHEVPAKLIAVITRCLAKDPADRYASMIELEVALCEAQIDGKLRTTWDDLVLPAIDADRHAKLLARMPTRESKRGVSAWWLPVLLAAGVLVGVMAWQTVNGTPAFAGLSARSDVDAFVGRAHAAAALAYYVYPPVDDPQADTAYKVLSQLEGIDSDEAREAAKQLRAELAEALNRVGDEIWGMTGGEPFALDFYVQAIMFDPSIEPARTRAALSLGERMALGRKASSGDFTETELIAVEPLQALSQPSAVELAERLEDLALRRRGTPRASTTAQLATRAGPQPSNQAPTTDASIGLPGDDEILAQQVAPSKKGSADAIVARANAARKSAQLDLAEKLYHKALRIEQHRLDALSGLGRVYFEQANYAKSVNYYEMAVRRSGSNSEFRIALGDAYVKTLDYAAALAQYQRAKQLGSSKADKRLARIEARTAG